MDEIMFLLNQSFEVLNAYGDVKKAHTHKITLQ